MIDVSVAGLGNRWKIELLISRHVGSYIWHYVRPSNDEKVADVAYGAL